MPIAILVMLIQIGCVVHVIKTGRNTTWIYVLLFLPLVGGLAYLLVEILPEWLGSRTARALGRSARQAVDPEGELRRLSDALAQADTPETRRRYALECLRLGRSAEAVAILEPALTGLYADDPSLTLDLARAHFMNGDPQRCLDLLDSIKQRDPDYTSTDAHLLYARALEASGRDSEAAPEYRHLIDAYPGEEARCRYALLLVRSGDRDGAARLFAEILERERRAPQHYRRAQAEWITTAREHAG